jgi:hypothetical protein
MVRTWDKYLIEEWSDAARAAAVVARQKRAGGKRVGAGFTPHKEYSKSMGSRFKSVGNKLKSAFGPKKPSVYKPKPLTKSIIAAKQDADAKQKQREAERERENRIFSKYARI